MTNREKLMQILDKPVFQEGKDPLEAVTDYLLENNVVPVVRCKDCKYCDVLKKSGMKQRICIINGIYHEFKVDADDYCSYGERRDENATD